MLSRIRLNSDAGTQYVSLAFTEALREAGMNGSIGSVGDCLLTTP
jgi:transposase InsO family protein